MPSESQHRLKSFLNGLMFSSVVKHGGPSNALSRDDNFNQKTTAVKPETNLKRPMVAQSNDETSHPDLPKTAFPSALPTNPRVSSLSYAAMASHRPTKKGKEKAVIDDRRPHVHSLRRYSHGLPINEVPDTDKHRLSAEQLVSPDLAASSETERLRREIEVLKKTIHDHKKTIKKHSKRNEELKNEVATGIAALTEKSSELSAKEEELRKVKDNFGKIESSMSSFETMFQCQVCIELLHRPYVLSPCGHVFCLLCLQEWFRKAPATGYDDEGDLENPRYILRRPKSCPCCRTKITHRPIPLFVVRSAINALAGLKAQLSGAENPTENLTVENEGDPWRGIFPTGEDDELSTSDEDEELSSESGGADSLDDDRLSVHYTHYTDEIPNAIFAYESASESENLSEGYHDDNDPDYDSEDEDDYARPRWQPASRYMGIYGVFAGSDDEENRRMISLLRRGCPLQMILSFRMTYSRQEGIIAYVPSLDPALFLDDGNTDVDLMHRVLLGWNIEVDEEMDKYGCNFMQQMLSDLEDFPQRWEVQPRLGMVEGPMVYDAMRLVRMSEMEDYDSDLASYLEDTELD